MRSEEMVEELLAWFIETKRELPWRKSYDPYHVWISEIMLQQTQMERGVRYFLRWIKRFPGVQDVAEAKEQEILKYWEGLGYYARARNLHKAAKVLVQEFSAQVPCDYEKLLTLPGIGPYTAAAIASVAGNRDVAVVDANVCRVFARLFDIDQPVKSGPVQKRVHILTTKLMPKGNARRYNQALMDLGGLICTPKSPRCPECPVRIHCAAERKGVMHLRPVLAQPKKTVFITRVAGLIRNNGLFYIQKRAENLVWGGLWEFPGGDLDQLAEKEINSKLVEQKIFEDCSIVVDVERLLCTVQHQYTNHKITLHCYLCDIKKMSSEIQPHTRDTAAYRWLGFEELRNYGFPAGPRKVLEYIKAHEIK